jgi:uncharacterized protein (TIGR02270 family)
VHVASDPSASPGYRAFVLRAVVEQHVEDAAFQFMARRAAVVAPNVRLADLARIDERLGANLDGIRIAGRGGVKLSMKSLAFGEAGEIFTATIAACMSDRLELLDEISCAGDDDEVATGVGGALAWLPKKIAEAALDRLRSSTAAGARRAFALAATAHRTLPNQVLFGAFLDDGEELRALAFGAIGALGRRDLVSIAEAGMLDDHPKCRLAAAWSAALFERATAAEVLRAIAIEGGSDAENAARHAAVALAPDEAKAWIGELAQKSEHHRLAIIAAAALGDPSAIPMLVAWCDSPTLSRLAGAGLETITGIAIEGGLGAAPPASFVEAKEAEKEDDSFVEDPDALLRWPATSAVGAACEKKALKAGERHLFGAPIGRASLLFALRDGRQPERARAAFELARAGETLFDVAAPTQRQLTALVALGVAPPNFSYDS